MRSRLFLLGCLSLPLAAPLVLHAQQALTSASVTGRVLDPSGATMPHTTVIATALATNQVFTTSTDSLGRFRFPYLAVGQYRVQAQAANFSPASRQIQLTVGAAFNLDLALSLASAHATMQVTETAPVIEQDRSEIAETISQSEVMTLPYEGRNYLDLALLAPGVSPTNTASTQTLAETSSVVGQGYSVNSQRNFSNSFVVDRALRKRRRSRGCGQCLQPRYGA